MLLERHTMYWQAMLTGVLLTAEFVFMCWVYGRNKDVCRVINSIFDIVYADCVYMARFRGTGMALFFC